MSTFSRDFPALPLRQVAYGAFFILLVPCFFFWLARFAPVPLPALRAPLFGTALLVAGGLCMASGMLALVTLGKGLPMNAFPPKLLVTGSVYALLPHPIYCGFVFACAGVSLLLGSAAGLWLVTPLAALASAALVWGYERPYLLSHHHAVARPWIGLPLHHSVARRVGMAASVLLPWLVLFYAVKYAGAPADAFTVYVPGEASLPVLVWTYPLYAFAYLFVPMAFVLSTDAGAEKLFWRGWASFVVMGVLYVTVPLVSPVRAFVPQGWLGDLLVLEMAGAAPYTAAFPSYHVVWAVLAASALAEKGRLWAWGAWALALGISASCVTTGMHVLVDSAAGLGVGLMLCRYERFWGWLLRATERLANSFRAWRIGRWRILSHAPHSFFSGFLCVFLPCLLLGQQWLWPILGMLVLGVVGAGLWGQLLEGSSPLQRPFGYFGTVIGIVGLGAILLAAGLPVWGLLAAIACSAPWVQAAGRLRCIVQGCCHGKPVAESIEQITAPQQNAMAQSSGAEARGIVVTNPASRVVSLSGLGGVAIHATQLYSILGNLVAGALLFRFWQLGAPAALLSGLYLVFSGLLRFVEEGYRGESQTAYYYGLPVYQWLAVGMFVVGCLLLAVPSPAVPHQAMAWGTAFWAGLPAGVLVTCAMSIDIPESTTRFARLSG